MKVISVLWHSVEPDSINPEFLNGANPTASLFREQLRFLVDRYTPISIREFVKIQESPSLAASYKKPPMLLTFDDGFKNVLDQALPVLAEFQAPALFFVIGEVVENPEFVPWYVECIHMLRRTTKRNLTYGNVALDLSSGPARRRVLDLLEVFLRKCKVESDRQRSLVDLAQLLDVQRPTGRDVDSDLRFVSSDDLAKLGPSSLLTLASHTMTHRFLDTLSHEEQERELHQSHSVLSKCAAYFPALAYPGGFFNADTVVLAKQMYKCAFAVCLGSSYRNTYRYPRIGVGQDSIRLLDYAISPKRVNYIIPLKRFLHTTGLRRTL